VSAAWTAPAANAQTKLVEGNAEAGRSMALLACTGCHVVAPDQPFKPIRTGLPRPPDFKEIADRPNITAASLRHYLEILPAVPENSHMPNLVLSTEEIRDVAAFIISLRDKPAAPVHVGASPVAPQTTSAVAPFAIGRSQSCSNAPPSIFSPSLNGVGNAGAYPDSLETCRPMAHIGVRSGDPELPMNIDG
jgi:mono/diheme cytochrome c family protein